jgi:hypothetical protein
LRRGCFSVPEYRRLVRRPASSAILLLLFGLSGFLAGCGWAGTHDRTSKPDGFLLHGYVSATCASPTADIHEGSEVKVTDDTGHAIASGTLGASVTDGAKCNFPFEISNVPGAKDTVVVLVGTQPAAKFQTSQLREGATAVVSVTSATTSTSPS